METWNYLAPGISMIVKVLKEALFSARGTPVRVAPLRDRELRSLGVWLQGEAGDVDGVRRKMETGLKRKGIRFTALRWEGAREGR